MLANQCKDNYFNQETSKQGKGKPNIYTFNLWDRPGFKLEYKAISGKFVQNPTYIVICDQMLTYTPRNIDDVLFLVS